MQISIQQRLIYTVLFLSLILMTLGGMGLYNLQQVNQSLKTVYEDRVVPLKQLKIIADAYAVNIIDAANKAQVGLLNAENTTQQVAAAQQIIAQQWQAYKATTLTADESRLAQTAEQRFAVANQKIMLLKQFLAQQQGPIQGQLTEQIGILYPAIDPVGEIIGDLMNLQLDVAKAEYLQAQANYQQVKILTIGLILFGLC